MKVLFVTSEALPFAASGGLAEVSGSLPRALRQRLIGCRVVLPLYESVPQEWRDQMRFVTSFTVPVAWRRQYCGLFEARVDGVIYYLLDNQYYFKRAGLYGHYDDAERFAFFSRAVLEMLQYIDFRPDILHANDWQAALAPVYYSLFYSDREEYRHIHHPQHPVSGKVRHGDTGGRVRHPGRGAVPGGAGRLHQPDEGRH